MARNKAKGSEFERDVARFLGLRRTWPLLSQGDIHGPNFVLECKNVASFDLPAFCQQAQSAACRAGRPFWFVVIKRRRANVSESYVVTTLEIFRRRLAPKDVTLKEATETPAPEGSHGKST